MEICRIWVKIKLFNYVRSIFPLFKLSFRLHLMSICSDEEASQHCQETFLKLFEVSLQMSCSEQDLTYENERLRWYIKVKTWIHPINCWSLLLCFQKLQVMRIISFLFSQVSQGYNDFCKLLKVLIIHSVILLVYRIS